MYVVYDMETGEEIDTVFSLKEAKDMVLALDNAAPYDHYNYRK